MIELPAVVIKRRPTVVECFFGASLKDILINCASTVVEWIFDEVKNTYRDHLD